MSTSLRSVLVAAVLTGVVLVALPLGSHAAGRMDVDVLDDRYDDGDRDGNGEPATTVVHAGDVVVWRWADDNANLHTVTSFPDGSAFDSDSPCQDTADTTPCRDPGTTYAVTFDEPGRHLYACEVHGLTMSGVIDVQPAASPSPTPSESGSPSAPPPQPSPSESPTPSASSPSPSPSPSPEPSSSASTPSEPAPSASTSSPARPRRASAPGFGVRAGPDTSGPGPDPQVAPADGPSVSFSPFPSEPDRPTPSETADVVSVPVPADGGPSRGVLVGVATASVLGSAGIFGKVILFGRPWG